MLSKTLMILRTAREREEGIAGNGNEMGRDVLLVAVINAGLLSHYTEDTTLECSLTLSINTPTASSGVPTITPLPTFTM